MRLLLDLGGCRVIAKVPNKSDASVLERGAIVAFGWLARDCQAFADWAATPPAGQPPAPIAAKDAAWLPSTPLTNW